MLEALEILASGGNLWTLHQILKSREEVHDGRGEPLPPADPEVIRGLQLVDPEVSSMFLAGGDGSRPRTVMLRSSKHPRAVPIRSYGDGMNRLVELVLCLVSAAGGLRLIDEFETGLHHMAAGAGATLRHLEQGRLLRRQRTRSGPFCRLAEEAVPTRSVDG